MKIVTFPRSIVRGARSVPGFEARVGGNPKLWGCGTTEDEAVRDVLRSHAEHVSAVYEVEHLGRDSEAARSHRACEMAANLFPRGMRAK